VYKANGRFSKNKSYLKDTSLNVSTVEGSGHFISDKEKFDRNILNENIAQTNKRYKNVSTLCRLNNFQKQNEFMQDRVDLKMFLEDQQKMVSLNERSKKLRIYEMVINSINVDEQQEKHFFRIIYNYTIHNIKGLINKDL
jgi:hypothetical protein